MSGICDRDGDGTVNLTCTRAHQKVRNAQRMNSDADNENKNHDDYDDDENKNHNEYDDNENKNHDDDNDNDVDEDLRGVTASSTVRVTGCCLLCSLKRRRRRRRHNDDTLKSIIGAHYHHHPHYHQHHPPFYFVQADIFVLPCNRLFSRIMWL